MQRRVLRDADHVEKLMSLVPVCGDQLEVLGGRTSHAPVCLETQVDQELIT